MVGRPVRPWSIRRLAGTKGTTSAGPAPTRTRRRQAGSPEPKGDTEGADGDAPRRSAAAAGDEARLAGNAAEGAAGAEGLAPVAEVPLPPSEERASGAACTEQAAVATEVSQVDS